MLAKLAIAFATAVKIYDEEVIGTLNHKVLYMLDQLDEQVRHFMDYTPGSELSSE